VKYIEGVGWEVVDGRGVVVLLVSGLWESLELGLCQNSREVCYVVLMFGRL
jgi:hypothetical protein